jgi:uncharacterized protein (TIGR03435 family)
MMHTPPGRAQSTPKFEVASIRPCKPGDFGGKGGTKTKGGGGGPDFSPGRLQTGCMALADSNSFGLIQRAYVRYATGNTDGFNIVEIKGGPAWIRSDLYRIHAIAEGKPSRQMMEGPMMQAFLEDRFKLRIHRETKEVPVYELTVAKEGHKLASFVDGSCVVPTTFPSPQLPPGQKFCGVMITINPAGLKGQGVTLDNFSKMLDRVLDRPVINKTGITGKFDINLEFAVDETTSGLRSIGDNPVVMNQDRPSIFTTIKQLGLKLEPAKGPHEFIVIDHVERPSAN